MKFMILALVLLLGACAKDPPLPPLVYPPEAQRDLMACQIWAAATLPRETWMSSTGTYGASYIPAKRMRAATQDCMTALGWEAGRS